MRLRKILTAVFTLFLLTGCIPSNGELILTVFQDADTFLFDADLEYASEDYYEYRTEVYDRRAHRNIVTLSREGSSSIEFDLTEILGKYEKEHDLSSLSLRITVKEIHTGAQNGFLAETGDLRPEEPEESEE